MGKATNPALEDIKRNSRDEGFNAGTIAALAVLFAHDAETIWCEVLNAAGPKQVMHHALSEEGDWEWGGFKKYAMRNFKTELTAVRRERAAAKRRSAIEWQR